MHGRWAMLAVAGILTTNWLESLGLIKDFLEGPRWVDMISRHVDIQPTFLHKKKPKPNIGYLGGVWFDPFMWRKESSEPLMVLRMKEIKNGRLAMLAFVFQTLCTGQDPIENLMALIVDPDHYSTF
ncbi:unnamed protein product [Fraxinus pennsylvanica]|uniref:Chlorophyll a-b binding protein, chloroplastic n=1 Tax=Fraxinus pennsylvanica TaxID=56036 RepID=A0AAD2E6C1_9LAMI|nr:unnamed protein product [Fraxinus pennsylvanica]